MGCRGRTTAGQQAADGALDRAQCALEEAEARRPEVEAVARVLRVARGENHFAERISAVLRGGTP
ncbi:DUF7620 family protein [Streptomyces sp. NRRL S-241]|uniref:DUF7620 family protein n=1 Tax=Streptomyces sp. NRRL S-241 TaxID=1463896 RepID=UPI0004C073EC